MSYFCLHWFNIPVTVVLKWFFLSICRFVLIINSFLSHIHFSQTRSCLFNLQNVLKNPTRRTSCFKFFKSTYLFVKVWLLKYWSFLRWHVGRIDWNVRFFFTNSSVDKVQYIFTIIACKNINGWNLMTWRDFCEQQVGRAIVNQ